ncbi:MAG TPA: FAD-binding protein [Polyangiaceae bacterium]|nr:FAD-binding protein [Polyangiaceae bacterium]
MDIIERGGDGFHHPSTQDELRALVRFAHDRGIKLRVMGSGHSVAGAILGAGGEDEIRVMLDRYVAVTWVEEHDDYAVVDVQAGCHLGRAPYDPTESSTWASSLNVQLQRKGYALDDLGGISHQTVSGFLSTGSSGGSLTFSVEDNLLGFTFIDGTGKVHRARADAEGEERDLFDAVGVSMGLLGVISEVRLRVRKTFNVVGKQVTSSTGADCAVDLFGAGDGRPSLTQYLRDTGYTRLMWWPQHDFGRIQMWEANRVDPTPDFEVKPYLELGRMPRLASLAGSLLYTIIGNLDDLSVVPDKLVNWRRHLEGSLEGEPDPDACPHPDPSRGTAYSVGEVVAYLQKGLTAGLKRHPTLGEESSPARERSKGLIEAAVDAIEDAAHEVGDAIEDVLGWVLAKLIELVVDGALTFPLTQKLADWFKGELPDWIDEVLGIFVSEGTITFQDCWMCGLPMDNQMDDQLWPTDFTELWIPIERTGEVMCAMRDWYSGDGDPEVALARTGTFSCELYPARKSRFWMSPAYDSDVFRVDVFWFGLNAGDPATDFYPQFWELLKRFDFRPHWGKYLPPPDASWAAHYRRVLPRMADFLTLRAKLDPKGIFLTDYWAGHLGIE